MNEDFGRPDTSSFIPSTDFEEDSSSETISAHIESPSETSERLNLKSSIPLENGTSFFESTQQEKDLQRYFNQILNSFKILQNKNNLTESDKLLLEQELSNEKSNHAIKLSGLEKEHKEYIDILSGEIQKLRDENLSLTANLQTETKEKSLHQKNAELLENKIKHLSSDILLEKESDYLDKIESLEKTVTTLKEEATNLSSQIESLKQEVLDHEKLLEEEQSQKNDMISRFRDEVATLEEKHQLKMDRQRLEIEEKAFAELKKLSDSIQSSEN